MVPIFNIKIKKLNITLNFIKKKFNQWNIRKSCGNKILLKFTIVYVTKNAKCLIKNKDLLSGKEVFFFFLFRKSLRWNMFRKDTSHHFFCDISQFNINNVQELYNPKGLKIGFLKSKLWLIGFKFSTPGIFYFQGDFTRLGICFIHPCVHVLIKIYWNYGYCCIRISLLIPPHPRLRAVFKILSLTL